MYALAISGYLEYCSRNTLSVTKATAQGYMRDVIRRGLAKCPDLWKEGINWFFKNGRQHCAVAPAPSLPTLGQADTGAQPWERRLIERLRIQHYAWRTEQTYREWAWRLAQFMHPRDLESATGEDKVSVFINDTCRGARVEVGGRELWAELETGRVAKVR